MWLHGLSSQRFFREPGTFIHASQTLTACFAAPTDGAPAFDANNIEAEALGLTAGVAGRHEPWVDRDNLLLRERIDLDRLAPPIVGQSGRMPFGSESYQRFAQLTRTSPVCACCAPLTLAAQLRGTPSLIMDMYRDPAFVDRLLAFFEPGGGRAGGSGKADRGHRRCHRRDVHAEARPPIMSPSLIRRFCLPHVEAVIRETSSTTCT